MERKRNDEFAWNGNHKAYREPPDDYYLDEPDDEEFEDYDADDLLNRVKGQPPRYSQEPYISGYEAFERSRGRRTSRKLTRREKRAIKKAEKMAEKLRKEQEKADKKAAKKNAKVAAREEKRAAREEQKASKHKPKQKKSSDKHSSVKNVPIKSGTVKASPVKETGNRKPMSKAEEKKAKEKRLSAQKSIPYREMARDGICRVQDKYYSKTIRFYDINYQLAQNEDKNAIFENWCDFLNYFDSTIHFQLSFINHHSNMKEYESVIQIRPQNDAF